MPIAIMLILLSNPQSAAEVLHPIDTHRPVELSLGTGYNAPSGAWGLRIGVRPLSRWSVALALGGAPASTNPDLSGLLPPVTLCRVFFNGQPADDVKHIGPAFFRVSATTAYHHPLQETVELVLRVGVERNPGAVRTKYERLEEEGCDESGCGSWVGQPELTPTAWVGLLSVGLTKHFSEQWFLRFEAGGVLPLYEEISDSESRPIDRSRIPDGATVSFWLGFRLG